MKSSQIEHNLQIYHRYQQIPFAKGAPFSKPPFLGIQQLVFGSVSFPLGNFEHLLNPKKKKIHPTRGHDRGHHQFDNPKIYNELPGLPHRPFVWRSLLSRLWAWPPPRLGSTSKHVPSFRMGSMEGKHATDEPGNLEIR